jgi:hypothetical protein
MLCEKISFCCSKGPIRIRIVARLLRGVGNFSTALGWLEKFEAISLLSGNFSEGAWQGIVIAKEKRLLGVLPT